MKKVIFKKTRVALEFGGESVKQKINLYQLGSEFEPKAQHVQQGSMDLCFVSPVSLEVWIKSIIALGVEIIEGPVNRTGAAGEIESIYFRDSLFYKPDGNLIELANYK